MRLILSLLIMLATLTPMTKASDPIRVCGLNMRQEWKGHLVQAVAELNRAVPAEISNIRDCDIQVMVVRDIHSTCSNSNWGCAYGSWRAYIVDSTYGQIATLLHELMHTFGIGQHDLCGLDSALSSTFDPYRTILSDCDIQLLQAVHS